MRYIYLRVLLLLLLLLFILLLLLLLTILLFAHNRGLSSSLSEIPLESVVVLALSLLETLSLVPVFVRVADVEAAATSLVQDGVGIRFIKSEGDTDGGAGASEFKILPAPVVVHEFSGPGSLLPSTLLNSVVTVALPLERLTDTGTLLILAPTLRFCGCSNLCCC